MVYKRRVRATELAGHKNERVKWYHLAALIVVGVIFFVFMERWRRETGGDRFQKAEEFSQYYRDFFIPYPKKYLLFDEKVPMVIRARNLGQDFFNRDLPNYIVQSENEVTEMMSEIDVLRKTDEKNEMLKKRFSFKNNPELFELIKLGKSLSEKTLFNIADGEIIDFWDTAFRRHKKWAQAKATFDAALSILLPDEKVLFDKPGRIDTLFSQNKKNRPTLSQKAVITQLARLDKKLAKKVNDVVSLEKDKKKRERNLSLSSILLRSRQKMEKTKVLPNMAALHRFIPYATTKHIALHDTDKSVQITNPNTAIEIEHFKYALFLNQLRKKLPKDFDYLILLGDRHGMWRLPKKFIRWTLAINDPFALLNRQKGAIKLYEEEGAFAIVRRREDHFSILDDTASQEFKNRIGAAKDKQEVAKIIRDIKEQFPSTNYLVDITTQRVKKIYSRPVNWQTGKEAVKYKSVIVLNHNPVRARMYASSLFISKKADIVQFEKQFPQSVFIILNNDNTLFIPPVSKDYFVSNKQLSNQEEQQKKVKETLTNSPNQK